jgi:hypothetical protein
MIEAAVPLCLMKDLDPKGLFRAGDATWRTRTRKRGVLRRSRQSKIAAVASVRDAVQPGDYVELTERMLSTGTVQALGLRPGLAKPM